MREYLAVLASAGLALAVSTFFVACGQPRDNDGAQVISLTEEEQIRSKLLNSFGTYDPYSEENMKLAARVRGASASVVAVSEGELTAGVHDVRVTVQLDQEVAPIGASQRLLASYRDEFVNESAVPNKYKFFGRCVDISCNDLVVLLQETITQSSVAEAADAVVEGEKPQASHSATDGESSAVPVLIRQTALVFKRKTENDKVSTEAKADGQSKPSAKGSMTIRWAAPSSREAFASKVASLDGSNEGGASSGGETKTPNDEVNSSDQAAIPGPDTEVSVDIDGLGDTEVPVATDNPGDTDDSVGTDNLDDTKDPVGTDSLGDTEVPVATNDPGATDNLDAATGGVVPGEKSEVKSVAGENDEEKPAAGENDEEKPAAGDSD